MFRWTLAITLAFLAGAGLAQDAAACDVNLEDVLRERHLAPLVADESIAVDDPVFVDLFAAFSADVAAALAACDDPAHDFTLDVTVRVSAFSPIMRYPLVVRVLPLDVNLDAATEWLVWVQVGTYGYGNGQAFMDLYVRPETGWARLALWPAEPVAAALAAAEAGPRYTLPREPYIYPQADVDGRSYMGVWFAPGIGPDYHVDGLWVVRWDGFTPETVLFDAQGCLFADWQVGADGGLYIPFGGVAVPWEGCTIPHMDGADGLPIPGAVMATG